MNLYSLITDQKYAEFKYLILLFFAWCFAFLVIGGVTDFPLNDDWSYGITTKRLLESATYRPIDWTSMSLVSQVFFGALFCLPFGFSFTALHVSTIVLAFFGMVSVYKICRMLNASDALSGFVALVIMFNPVYLALSGTFMTDVPFLSFVSLSTMFLIKSLKFKNFYSLVGGAFFLVLAVLCRQNALFLGVAFFVFFLIRFSPRLKIISWAILPLAMATFSLFLYNKWLQNNELTPALYGKQIFQLVDVLKDYSVLPERIFQNAFNITVYVGLFLFPILLLTANKVYQDKKLRFVFLFLLLCLSIKYINSGATISLWGNILVKEGIGPLTLHDSVNLKLLNSSPLSNAFWIGVTLVAIVGTSLLVTLIIGMSLKIRILLKQERFVFSIFFTFAAVIYIGPLLLLGFFDRYLLVPVVLGSLALIPILGNLNKFARIMSLSALVCFGLFTLASVHDYLAWNKTRWKIIDSFKTKNININNVDGGFEYNGFFFYEKSSVSNGKLESWWWVEDNKYLIAFGPVRGFHIYGMYEYDRWLKFQKENIYLLERD